ncbi:MAG: RDD family protein [Alphaproteobacteria bacterium]|nr:RDD family protein [Alphaproteobacteria bacterium]
MSPPTEPNTSWPEPVRAPGLRRRMACWLYEGMLLFGVIFIAGYLFSTLSQTRHALVHRMGQQAFVFLVLGIYFVWFWHKGQTLAMKTWHIRIVDTHGHPVSQARALARYLLSWSWFLPPLALIRAWDLPVGSGSVFIFGWISIYAILSRFQAQGQFWHDALAGTRLIDARL